jgi:hypothetical protein
MSESSDNQDPLKDEQQPEIPVATENTDDISQPAAGETFAAAQDDSGNNADVSKVETRSRSRDASVESAPPCQIARLLFLFTLSTIFNSICEISKTVLPAPNQTKSSHITGLVLGASNYLNIPTITYSPRIALMNPGSLNAVNTGFNTGFPVDIEETDVDSMAQDWSVGNAIGRFTDELDGIQEASVVVQVLSDSGTLFLTCQAMQSFFKVENIDPIDLGANIGRDADLSFSTVNMFFHHAKNTDIGISSSPVKNPKPNNAVGTQNCRGNPGHDPGSGDGRGRGDQRGRAEQRAGESIQRSVPANSMEKNEDFLGKLKSSDNDAQSLVSAANSLNEDFEALDKKFFPKNFSTGPFKRDSTGKVIVPLQFAIELGPNANGFSKSFKKESDNDKYAPSGLYAKTAVLTDFFRLRLNGDLTWFGDAFASKQNSGGGPSWQKITKDFSAKLPKSAVDTAVDLSSISI